MSHNMLASPVRSGLKHELVRYWTSTTSTIWMRFGPVRHLVKIFGMRRLPAWAPWATGLSPIFRRRGFGPYLFAAECTGDGSLLGAPQGGNSRKKIASTSGDSKRRPRNKQQNEDGRDHNFARTCVPRAPAYQNGSEHFSEESLKAKNFHFDSISVDPESMRNKVLRTYPLDIPSGLIVSAHVPRHLSDGELQGKSAANQCMTGWVCDRHGKRQR